MIFKERAIKAIIGALIVNVLYNTPVYAADCLGATCAPPTFTTLFTFIPSLINVIIALSVTVFFIILVVNGYQFITAGGDTEKIENAKKSFFFSIIGFLIIFAGFIIIPAIVNITGINNGPISIGTNGSINFNLFSTYTPTDLPSNLQRTPPPSATPQQGKGSGGGGGNPDIIGQEGPSGSYLKIAHDLYKAARGCNYKLISTDRDCLTKNLLSENYDKSSIDSLFNDYISGSEDLGGCKGIQCLGFVNATATLYNLVHNTSGNSFRQDNPQDIIDSTNIAKIGDQTYIRKPLGTKPEVGDIAMFSSGAGGAGPLGHAAIVDNKVSGNDDFLAVESNWDVQCHLSDGRDHESAGVYFYRLEQ